MGLFIFTTRLVSRIYFSEILQYFLGRDTIQKKSNKKVQDQDEGLHKLVISIIICLIISFFLQNCF